MIVKWPGQIPPGVTDELSHSNDLFPTILSLSNAGPVESDGVDLTPLWMDRKSLSKRELFWRTPSHRAVRYGLWKLIMPLNDDAKPELYNLDDDPREEQNVAKEKPAIVEKLSDDWGRWEADMNLSAREYSQ